MFGEFLNKSTEFTQNFQEIQTLNKTYKINNIILDIIKDFSIEYRNITEIQIEHKYKEYQEEITNKLGLIQLKNKINKEIQHYYLL